MKKLVYTVSDFKTNALDCINLLYKSLRKNNSEFDFCIITNQGLIPPCPYPVFVDTYSPVKNYIGVLKYSSMVPAGYDQYFYLDSDILCFDKLENLCDDHNYSLVMETHMMTQEWFCYPAASPEDRQLMETVHGINAGSFGFKTTFFLEEVRERMWPMMTNRIENDSKMEQASFNYTLLKSGIFTSSFKDLTPKVQLFAQNGGYNPDKTIYHFCGFSNEMLSKYVMMLRFCIQNEIKL